MSALNTETLTTQGSALRSLRIMYVVPGDVVFIPFGTLICEKVLGGQCMALRVPMALFSSKHMFAAQMMMKVCDAKPLG